MALKHYCTIYLIRHGQSEANTNDIYGLDSELTKNGITQIKKLAAKLNKIKFDTIYSSNLLRAKQSAEIMSLYFDKEVNIDNSLRERFYGLLEGKRGSFINKKLERLFKIRSKLGYDERIKFKFSTDYESDEEVMARFIPCLQQIANLNLGKTILIISHATAMRSLLVYLHYISHTEMEGQAITNSGYIKLKSDGQDFYIEKVKR